MPTACRRRRRPTTVLSLTSSHITSVPSRLCFSTIEIVARKMTYILVRLWRQTLKDWLSKQLEYRKNICSRKLIAQRYSCVHSIFSAFLCLIFSFIMRPSSLGGGRILRCTLSVRLSVRPSRYCYRASRRAT